MDREELIRLLVAERFAPTGRAERRTRPAVDLDDDVTRARRRRVLNAALNEPRTAAA